MLKRLLKNFRTNLNCLVLQRHLITHRLEKETLIYAAQDLEHLKVKLIRRLGCINQTSHLKGTHTIAHFLLTSTIEGQSYQIYFKFIFSL